MIWVGRYVAELQVDLEQLEPWSDALLFMIHETGAHLFGALWAVELQIS